HGLHVRDPPGAQADPPGGRGGAPPARLPGLLGGRAQAFPTTRLPVPVPVGAASAATGASRCDDRRGRSRLKPLLQWPRVVGGRGPADGLDGAPVSTGRARRAHEARDMIAPSPLPPECPCACLPRAW